MGIDPHVATEGGLTPQILEGRSLLAADEPSSDIFFESNQCDREENAKTGCWPLGGEGKLYALRSGNLKLIRHPMPDGTRYQLFDLHADPAEVSVRWIDGSEEGAALGRRLDAWADGLAPLPVQPNMDHEILRNLQALGYLR